MLLVISMRGIGVSHSGMAKEDESVLMDECSRDSGVRGRSRDMV